MLVAMSARPRTSATATPHADDRGAADGARGILRGPSFTFTPRTQPQAPLLMAGRSGAALIETEWREAAKAFDARVLASRLRARGADGDSESIAAALDALAAAGTAPKQEWREGEMLLSFCGASGGDPAKRVLDISDLYRADGYSVELTLQTNEQQALKVVSCSFFIE